MGQALELFDLRTVPKLQMRRPTLRCIVDNIMTISSNVLSEKWKVLKKFVDTGYNIKPLQYVYAGNDRLIAYNSEVGIMLQCEIHSDRAYLLHSCVFDIVEMADGNSLRFLSEEKDAQEEWLCIQIKNTTFKAKIAVLKPDDYPEIGESGQFQFRMNVNTFKSGLKMMRSIKGDITHLWIGEGEVGIYSGPELVRQVIHEGKLRFSLHKKMVQILEKETYVDVSRNQESETLFLKGQEGTYFCRGSHLVYNSELEIEQKAPWEKFYETYSPIASFQIEQKLVRIAVKKLKATQKPKELCLLTIRDGKIRIENDVTWSDVICQAEGDMTMKVSLSYLLRAVQFGDCFCSVYDAFNAYHLRFQYAESCEYSCIAAKLQQALVLSRHVRRKHLVLNELRIALRNMSKRSLYHFQCYQFFETCKYTWRTSRYSKGDYWLEVSHVCDDFCKSYLEKIEKVGTQYVWRDRKFKSLKDAKCTVEAIWKKQNKDNYSEYFIDRK